MKILDWHWSLKLLLLILVGVFYRWMLWWYYTTLSFDRQETTDFALGLAGVLFAGVIAFVQVGMAMQDRAQGRKRETVALRDKFNKDAELEASFKRVQLAIIDNLSAPKMAQDGEIIGNANDVSTVAKWFEDLQIQHANGIIDDGLAYDYFYAHLLSVWPALTPYFAVRRTELRNKTIFSKLEALYADWSKR